jgi:hypothetical protein
MRILLINNEGGGFADYVDVPEGQTVGEFFAARSPKASPSSYLIRVNRLPCSIDQVLQPGDRCSITPVKIEGAAA